MVSASPLHRVKLALLAGCVTAAMMGALLGMAARAVAITVGDDPTKLLSIPSAAVYDMDADGTIVVWAQDAGTETGNDIWAYDVATGESQVVCDELGSQVFPRISGNWVVWQDLRSDDGDIYGKDLSTGAETAICIALGRQGDADVSGTTVVWSDCRADLQTADVYGYDLDVGTEYLIAGGEHNQYRSVVSGATVVWCDWDPSRLPQGLLRYCRLPDLTQHTVPSAQPPIRPDVDGSRIVWDTYDGVYVHDIETATTVPVGSATVAGYPRISGSIVAFVDYRDDGPGQATIAVDLLSGEEWEVQASGIAPAALGNGTIFLKSYSDSYEISSVGLGRWDVQLSLNDGREWTTSRVVSYATSASSSWGPITAAMRFGTDWRMEYWEPWQTPLPSGVAGIVTYDTLGYVHAQFADETGHRSRPVTATVKYDGADPVVTVVPDIPRMLDAWTNLSARVSASANDFASGLSPAGLEYCLDGGPWQGWPENGALTVPAPADHSADGVHPLLMRAADAAGNVTQVQHKLQIDTRRPRLSLPIAGSASGGRGIVKFKIVDAKPCRSVGRITVRIYTLGGRLKAERSPTIWFTKNTLQTYRFPCRLRPGIYRMLVSAKDGAGNTSLRWTRGTFVVR